MHKSSQTMVAKTAVTTWRGAGGGVSLPPKIYLSKFFYLAKNCLQTIQNLVKIAHLKKNLGQKINF